MLLKGKVDLTGDKGAKSIEIIAAAVSLAAEGIVNQIKEELAGG